MKKPKASSSGLLTTGSNSSTSYHPHFRPPRNNEPTRPSAADVVRSEVEERETGRDSGGDEVEEGDEEEEDDDGDEDEEEEEEDVEVAVGGAEAAATTAEQMIERKELAKGFFEVEAIRKRRICKGEPQYLIKWRDWPESSNTWEPVDHLRTCPDVVEAYEESLQSGQKKTIRKRKRKFTQPKKKMQNSYGATKSKVSPIKSSLGNEHHDSTALDNSNTHPQSGMVDIVVEHDESMNISRIPKKVDHNGSMTVNLAVISSDKDHSESVQLSSQNASGRNSVEHLQQSLNGEGDGPANQLSKPTCVEVGQSNQRRGAQRRKSGSVRRLTKDVTSFNTDFLGTALPVNASTSERAEQLRVGSSDASRNMKSDSSKSASSSITKIIKPIKFSASVTNNVQDVSVSFVVLRSDGQEVMVDNNFLKTNNPLLLIDFYEQHLRYNSS